MVKVSEIHYILHLTYDLDIRPEETVRLIDNTINFCQRNCRDSSKLFILEVNSFSQFAVPDHRRFSKILLEYYRQNKRIIGDLSQCCTNLIIGQTAEESIRGFESGESELDKMLSEKGLELDLSSLLIVGHGMYEEGCVNGTLYRFAKKIKERYGKNVSYRINDETTLKAPKPQLTKSFLN